MDPDAIYVMDNRRYTYDELCDAIEAEAETLPPETWRKRGVQPQRLHHRGGTVGVIEVVEDD